MTTEQMFSGAWFRHKGTDLRHQERIYKFVANRHTLTGLNPGFLVESSFVGNTTHFHCNVLAVSKDGTLSVYAYLLGEMVERTMNLYDFEIAPEN